MKPRIEHLALLALAVSCSGEGGYDVADKAVMEFYAGCDETRTAISGNAVEWEAGDQIGIFDRNSNNRFVTAQSGTSAVFRGTAYEEDSYLAVYPYDPSFTISSEGLNVAVPSVQTLRLGNIPEGANVSVAKSVGNVLYFKNICGYVKFTVSEGDFVKIVLEAASGLAVAGGVSVSFDEEGSPQVQNTVPSRTLTLLPSEQYVAPGVYYVPLLPAVYESGLTIYLYKENGSIYKSAVSLVDRIDRCVPLNIGVIDRNIEPYNSVLELSPETKTSLEPGKRSTQIYLTTNCKDVSASVKSGSSLENVAVTKISDERFEVTFTNPSKDPQVFNYATIVFSATGVPDVEVRIKQNGLLTLDFSTNAYGITTATDTEIHEFSIASAGQEPYVFNYYLCRWHTADRFLFKGGSSKPLGYISFPAIDGLRLKTVRVTVPYVNNSIKTLWARVTDHDADNPVTYSPSQTTVVSPEEPLKVAEYSLAESEKGVSYMLYASGNNNGYIQQIELVYVE